MLCVFNLKKEEKIVIIFLDFLTEVTLEFSSDS